MPVSTVQVPPYKDADWKVAETTLVEVNQDTPLTLEAHPVVMEVEDDPEVHLTLSGQDALAMWCRACEHDDGFITMALSPSEAEDLAIGLLQVAHSGRVLSGYLKAMRDVGDAAIEASTLPLDSPSSTSEQLAREEVGRLLEARLRTGEGDGTKTGVH